MTPTSHDSEFDSGDVVIILSPHQWNFAMPVDVEVDAQRPPHDRQEWEQVTENHLTIDSNGALQLDSPVAAFATCDVLPGRYIAEVSGRGFFTDGRLGTIDGDGDEWRIRLWPDDGSALSAPKMRPRQPNPTDR